MFVAQDVNLLITDLIIDISLQKPLVFPGA